MADAEYMLHKWQVGHFGSNNAGKLPRERADAIISILSQVSLARATDSIPPAPWNDLMGDLMRRYSSIVDCSTEQGVNNYAEGALALSGHYAADSSQWKSSLDLEQVMATEGYTKLLKAAKEKEIQLKAKIANVSSELRSCATQSVPGTAFTRDENVQQGKGPIDRLNNNYIESGITGQTSSEVGSGTGQMFSGRGRLSGNQQLPSSSSNGHPRGVLQTAARTHGPHELPNQGHARHPQMGATSIEGPGPSDMGPSGKGHPSNMAGQGGNQGRTAQQGNFNWAQGGPLSGGPCRFQSHGPMEGAPRLPSFGGDAVPGPRGTSEEGVWQNTMKRKKPTQDDFESIPPGIAKDIPQEKPSFKDFKTARQQLSINDQKSNTKGKAPTTSSYGTGRRVLGVTRKGRGLNSKFVPPVIPDEGETVQRYNSNPSTRGNSAEPPGQSEEVDERLQGIDPKMIDLIMKEIMDHGPPISWDDIAGLEYAKKTIKEIVVWPMLRPDIFHGLRGPPKGLLLFGPPGTGKTLIGKCIASQSKSTFFSISASSLTSKWVGEGEKMVRALFTVARCHQPAVIFIDEIDSLLSQRSTDEHESSRRIKTEFLIQLDGATCSDDDRLLVVGATNRPQEIDEAARRRLVKRLYIPLPELGARRQIILNLLSGQGNYSLTDEEVSLICEKTDGYSGADVANLCREAALGPIRSLDSGNIQHVSAEEVRPISYEDFVQAVEHVKPSVSPKDLEIYLKWNQTYGSGKT